MMARPAAAVFVLLAFVNEVAGFNVPTATSFATFGNEQAKELIKAWKPQPLKVGEGEVMTPQSTENMKRYVRARLLLEEPSLGCVAINDDRLNVILCRFSAAEHQVRITCSPNFLAPRLPSHVSRAVKCPSTLARHPAYILTSTPSTLSTQPPLACALAARPSAVAADKRAKLGVQGLGGLAQGDVWQRARGAAPIGVAPRGRPGRLEGRLPGLSASRDGRVQSRSDMLRPRGRARRAPWTWPGNDACVNGRRSAWSAPGTEWAGPGCNSPTGTRHRHRPVKSALVCVLV